MSLSSKAGKLLLEFGLSSLQQLNDNWYVAPLAAISLGILALSSFAWFKVLLIRAVALFIGGRLVATAGLQFINHAIWPVSLRNQKRLAIAASGLITFLFLILKTNSTALAALFWLAFFFYVGLGGFGLFRIFQESILLPKLLYWHRKGELPACNPLLFVVNEPRFTQRYVDRFTRWLSIALSQLQILPFIVTSAAVAGQSENFRKWLATYAASVIIVSHPRNSTKVKRDASIYSASALGLVLNLEATRSRSSAARFTDVLTANIIPISNSDSRLPMELRHVTKSLAYSGLRPVADSYLRFRSAQSDVERYLGLLDSVESLIKMSAIVLLSTKWEEGPTPQLSEKLIRPSLGHWIELLRTLIQIPYDSELCLCITDFWQRPLHSVPKRLIDESKGSGLDWKGELPRTHMHWVNWFVWLRNTTRGHGSIEEQKATALWHTFHETFLHMVDGLNELTLWSSLERLELDDSSTEFRGWHRSNEHDTPLNEFVWDNQTNFFGITPRTDQATPILLFPLCVEGTGRILVWNSVRGNAVEYTDYRTGELPTLSFGETNPRTLWERQVAQLMKV